MVIGLLGWGKLDLIRALNQSNIWRLCSVNYVIVASKLLYRVRRRGVWERPSLHKNTHATWQFSWFEPVALEVWILGSVVSRQEFILVYVKNPLIMNLNQRLAIYQD